MIIKDDKVVEAEKDREGASGEVPPPYSAQIASGSSPVLMRAETGPLDLTSPRPVPYPDIPPVNFLSIRRQNESIQGTYLVDPNLSAPEEAMAMAERKNLLLDCRNGSIKADVWVASRADSALVANDAFKSRKALLEVKSWNGTVVVKMNADCATQPFSLKASTHNGLITVALPRSFSGPLSSYTRNGWVSTSAALSANVTTFSDMQGTRKSFVGDYPSSGYGRGDWPGCELNVNCENGRVKLCYVDEMNESSDGSGIGGLLGKIFGLRT